MPHFYLPMLPVIPPQGNQRGCRLHVHRALLYRREKEQGTGAPASALQLKQRNLRPIGEITAKMKSRSEFTRGDLQYRTRNICDAPGSFDTLRHS
jgi:hypothetical protein